MAYTREELQKFYTMDYFNVLQTVQKNLSKKNSDLFSKEFMKENKDPQLLKEQQRKIRGIIGQYVKDNNIFVNGIDNQEVLVDLFYKDMVGYSVLDDYVMDKNDEFEEIDVNRWNDCEAIRRNGIKEKIAHFCCAEHACNVLSRMAQYSGGRFDEAMPMCEANLKDNTRFVAMRTPLIDDEAGIAASIRIVRPANFKKQFFLDSKTATAPEINLIEMALRYGISVLFIGETSSGKTTLMNGMLSLMPLDYRIYTIETGSRELYLVQKDSEGVVLNSIVGTLSRLSTDKTLNIDQSDLLEKALRFNPNIIVVGEMRGEESAAAVEAALTDHTVTSSLHAPDAPTAHIRIAQLYNKRYAIDANVATQMAAQAFPIVVTMKCLRDHKRHIMNITECITSGINTRQYRTLFNYNVTSTKKDENGKIIVAGQNEAINHPSDEMIRRFRNQCILDDELESLLSTKLTADHAA